MAPLVEKMQPETAGQVGNAGNQEREAIQVVEFILGNERFAIDLFEVREVVEYTTITRLPNVPPYIRGIIDLRGEITTIVDLKHRLNVVETANISEESRRIIVLDEKISNVKTGILVDDVTSVATFERDQIDNLSASCGGNDTAILGIIKEKRKIGNNQETALIIWIDIAQLINDIGEG
jgi:purine-binding chemotaxis protein CheW